MFFFCDSKIVAHNENLFSIMVDQTAKSLAIIFCYFGEFPWYFRFFLHSCGFKNTNVSFIIFSDQNPPEKKPGNVKFIFMDIEQFKVLASKKLNINVSFKIPYKLCDFKPAFGLIFEEYLTQYEFWGQGDIDVIYGNIRSFMTDELLAEHDILSVRHDYVTGCLSIFRNVPEVNNLFKWSRDYEFVFGSSRHFCFDECNFMYDAIADGQSILQIDSEIESFTHVVRKHQQDGKIKAYFDFIVAEGLPGEISFDNGTIVYKSKYEAILYHLIRLKEIYRGEGLGPKIPSKYRITDSKFILV